MDSLGVLIIGFLGGLCAGVVIGVSISFPVAALVLVCVFAVAMFLTLGIDSALGWFDKRIRRGGDDA